VGDFPCVSIHGLLTVIESAIRAALNGSKFHTHGRSQEVSMNTNDSDDDSEIFNGFDSDESAFNNVSDVSRLSHQAPCSLRRKIRQDLRAVKNTGFKVGYIGEITEGGLIVAVASRLDRLGIPEKVMDVWKVHRNDYLVLLLRYPEGYMNMERLFSLGNLRHPFVQMRIGLCDCYKPSVSAASMAFQGNMPSDKDGSHPRDAGQNTLRPFFISSQLNRLMSERFLGIVGLRIRLGFSWTGAELFFQASQGKSMDDKDADSIEYLEPDSWGTPPPPWLMTDHMADEGAVLSKMSFPLLAMQFTLRHFVRCTEFCLVCFCKKHDDFEAIKPYVCSNRLCLYQYITYGMGPSLEYEIKSQPCVVDMLVSLTYARTKAGKLEDFPTGLAIQIPDTNATHPRYHSATINPHTVFNLNEAMSGIVMDFSQIDKPRLTESHWIVIVGPEGEGDLTSANSWHCRVQHVGSNYVELSLPLRCGRRMTVLELKQSTKSWGKPQKVNYTIYDTSFDDLNNENKRIGIAMLLSTLPGIHEMVDYLASRGPDAALSAWHDRIQPAALDLLRWIVASNRSTIVRDNSNPEHLVSGMTGYIQFRLVQGAPDKEKRFIKAVQKYSMTTKPKHPTIFAWHGSPVDNWHSILRQGLHFKDIVHGRSFGNGVYMSPQFTTSIGYAGTHLLSKWPQSQLNLTSIISLNEVVNAPKDFLSTEPHYVVSQLDWIQPRYLFVGVEKGTDKKAFPGFFFPQSGDTKRSTTASAFYAQEPQHTARGPSGAAIQIPISVFSNKRRETLALSGGTVPETKTPTPRRTKKKASKPTSLPPSSSDHPDDRESIEMDIEDIKILLSDSDAEMIDAPPKKTLTKKLAGYIIPRKNKAKKPKVARKAPPATDFIPGSLTESSLPIMSPPQYATSFATKVLQKQLKETVRIQQKEPLHELGWYVDPNLTSGNLYQWIVEFHSFDKDLPLAKDMKAAKLRSIILEVRFPANYPMNPPFVRVIRPRFLEFQAGGGGHVTIGGAMCMELLTSTSWSAVMSMESLLLQVRLAITSTDPQPARLSTRRGVQDYSVGEAIAAYTRACYAHGWKIPDDLPMMQW
jgi:ubiquitin-conjugating enzyme E2 Q